MSICPTPTSCPRSGCSGACFEQRRACDLRIIAARYGLTEHQARTYIEVRDCGGDHSTALASAKPALES